MTRLSCLYQDWLAPVIFRNRTFRLAFGASLVATIYWGTLASDRFVSEAHIVIERTELSSGTTMDFGSLLSGVGVGNRSDQMLMRDHLLSVDMLQKLDARLDLRQHYGDISRDLFSRMWGTDRELELFHRHYLSRVSIEFDEHIGVLIIKSQAYTPDFAYAITQALVDEGEVYMNALAHRLAREQVNFLEQQVELRAEGLQQSRMRLLRFQNDKGLVSPQETVASMADTINRLEAQLTELKTTRSARLGQFSPNAPAVVELDIQIVAIEQQISRERARLTSSGGEPLNVVVEEFQRLQLAAEFAYDMYKTALTALEKGRVEATRTLKKVSILQSPTKPQYPLEPRRIYNITVFIIVIMVLAGIIHLLAAIVRDHKD